eukprot:9406967-Pyramimonas_sp.AAC.1
MAQHAINRSVRDHGQADQGVLEALGVRNLRVNADAVSALGAQPVARARLCEHEDEVGFVGVARSLQCTRWR